MEHPGYASDKDDVLKRLRRIEGQARGLQRMVEEEQYCIDILTQVSAMTKALQAVALGLLDDHLAHCVRDAVAHRRGRRREADRGLRRDRAARPVLNRSGLATVLGSAPGPARLGEARGTGRMEASDTPGGAMSDQPPDQSSHDPSERPPLHETIRAKLEEYEVERHLNEIATSLEHAVRQGVAKAGDPQAEEAERRLHDDQLRELEARDHQGGRDHVGVCDGTGCELPRAPSATATVMNSRVFIDSTETRTSWA